ncbi:undecaprenyldiphospho-muramoylpentapeptide beta-N-acetylglucosaminyltransferase [Parvularcula maris]|uniref:UDP-N-acetylglucosamine--N-acetylmuramyl-(pentapeptide) pyrophosphoryl-undecaprenol N-acetylglucosamine transferase n=1 Tax=Parvularcula maris TaxID=2965077 RepID=A0A9X2L8T3_9PROT|nr:undecaprenyldiphospho-muramoylpentapeptide beta-N-acetylglucosaminyltransferase [Parvularcula maris]MCQ8185083.1 undecaprenyldiphospho-muramoylpentapeptide beta-N-acetylglucosaminyltransferase [Parvularcula maris]
MRLALAAGGTGGHMFPAQAVAEEAKARGWSVILLTDARGDRYADGFPCDQKLLLKAASPSSRGIGAKLSAGMALLQGTGQAKKALKSFGADAALGFGGYPSAPSMLAASQLNIPTGVHEQNAVLGRANRLAARKAQFIAHAFPSLSKTPGKIRLIEAGNPVRCAVLEAASQRFEPPGQGPIKLLIFGGSQGASLFARVFPKAVASLNETIRQRLHITHQVSDSDREDAQTTYTEACLNNVELAPFFTDLPQRIADSHLVIARSGASSVTELAVIGRPSLLVPLKIAMDDHQRANAEVLTGAGAAELILEDDLSPDSAAAILTKLLGDPQHLTAMAESAKGRMTEGAAKRLADLAKGLTPGHI